MSRACVMCANPFDLDATYFDVCDDCGIKIARRYADRLHYEENLRNSAARTKQWEAHLEQQRREKAARPPSAPVGPWQKESVVYYVRLGEHVKIGYSTQLIKRLDSLRATPSQVLAVEPGGRQVESQRHEQFGHLRVRPRWEEFRDGDDLLVHIQHVLAEHGRPDWLDYKRPRPLKNATPVVIRRVGE